MYHLQLVRTDSLDRIVLTDVTTHVMVVIDSMVLVILGVTPDGKDMSVKMVMEILYTYIICTELVKPTFTNILLE